MPVYRTNENSPAALGSLGLAPYGSPVMLQAPAYPGMVVSSDDCYAAQCGVPGLSDEQRYVCSWNGYVGARAGCVDTACEPFRSQLNCPTYAPPAPNYEYTPPAPTYTPPATYTAPLNDSTPPQPIAPVVVTGPAPVYQTPTVRVQTPGGSVEVPADVVPGVADLALTPASVRIPTIWDQLDPDKLSQFAYRGLSTSFPVWMTQAGRAAAQTAAAGQSRAIVAGPVAGDDNGAMWWGLAAVVAALLLFSSGKRRRGARK